jgi:hypothetical protein
LGKGTQIVFTLLNVSASEDDDDYTIMGTVAKPTHEQNVNILNTYAPCENWHTQKPCLVHLALQGEQNVQNKVPPMDSTIKLITLSPSSKRPKTTPKSLT